MEGKLTEHTSHSVEHDLYRFRYLGIVAPFTVAARVLLKDFWKVKGQQWDTPLPEELASGNKFDFLSSNMN